MNRKKPVRERRALWELPLPSEAEDKEPCLSEKYFGKLTKSVPRVRIVFWFFTYGFDVLKAKRRKDTHGK